MEAWYKTTSPNIYYASNGVSVVRNAHIDPLYSNSVFTVINGVPDQSLTAYIKSITSRVKALEDKAGITASDPTTDDSDTHDATE